MNDHTRKILEHAMSEAVTDPDEALGRGRKPIGAIVIFFDETGCRAHYPLGLAPSDAVHILDTAKSSFLPGEKGN